jgi:hypothetical protein
LLNRPGDKGGESGTASGVYWIEKKMPMMRPRLMTHIIDEIFENFISHPEIAGSIELLPERYWCLIEAMLKIAFEAGTLAGVRAPFSQLEWPGDPFDLIRGERST